jgi:hypothetical protein
MGTGNLSGLPFRPFKPPFSKQTSPAWYPERVKHRVDKLRDSTNDIKRGHSCGASNDTRSGVCEHNLSRPQKRWQSEAGSQSSTSECLHSNLVNCHASTTLDLLGLMVNYQKSCLIPDTHKKSEG